MALSVQQAAFVAGVLFLDASTINPADGAHIAWVYPYDFTAAVPVITLDGQGTLTRTTSAGDFTVAYPPIGPEDAGKLLILRYGHVNNAGLAGNTFTTPSAFTDRFAADQQIFLKNWIASRVCDGTESGAVTITVTGGTVGGRYGRIDMWAGVDTTTDDGIYAPSISKASSTTIDDAGVTTTADNDAAVNVVLHTTAGVITDFAGESGGAWLGGADEASVNSGLFYDLDVDTTTISGGTMAVSTGAWIVRGFALKAAVPEPEPEPSVDVSTGGGGGWHGDYDFRLRPREKKNKPPQAEPLAPAAEQAVANDDAEIVAILMMLADY